MKRPSYRAAIEWMALEDDVNWIYTDDKISSTSAVLVADLFGVSTERVTRDLIRFMEKRLKIREQAVERARAPIL